MFDMGCVVMIGVMIFIEVMGVFEFGVDVVKIFFVLFGGFLYFGVLCGLFFDVLFMFIGGVSFDNFVVWFVVGVVVVGVGGDFVNSVLIVVFDWVDIEQCVG